MSRDKVIWLLWRFYITRAENPTYEDTQDAIHDIATLVSCDRATADRVIQENISVMLELEEVQTQIRSIMNADRDNNLSRVHDLIEKRDELKGRLL
jgi:hypothetical protein